MSRAIKNTMKEYVQKELMRDFADIVLGPESPFWEEFERVVQEAFDQERTAWLSFEGGVPQVLIGNGDAAQKFDEVEVAFDTLPEIDLEIIRAEIEGIDKLISRLKLARNELSEAVSKAAGDEP